NIFSYLNNEDSDFEQKMLDHILASPHEPIRNQITVKHKSGALLWCDVAFTNYLDDPHIQGIVFNLRDYTKQKKATDIVYHLANYDYLTGLPNRRYFENQLLSALQAAKTTQTRLALLFLD